MRVGIFTDSYLPYTSGVVHSIETFKEELVTMDHELYVFAPGYPGCRQEQQVFRFPSIPAPTNRDFALALPFSPQLRVVLGKWRPEVIHVHSPFMLGRVGVACARRLNIPLVFTFHTLYEEYVHYVPFAQNITKKITRLISRNFCNRCDLVIVPTAVIGDYLRKIGVYVSIKTIPTGIKIEEFSYPDRGWLKRQYDIPEEDKVLLFVGRLGQEKNITFLVESFRRIAVEFPRARLVLVGGGPEEEPLKRRVRKQDLWGRVFFAGKRPKDEVAKYYAGADLFVFASVTETQGLVIAEAKAAGLPVVAVKAYGVSEMVADGEDGFLTELSHDSFIKKILLLLSDDELRKSFSEKARKNAEKISARNCALSLVDSYQKLIDR
ncbi:MAG TPA: glycosyltransferase family 4 protein [Desulfotomaculum sp.]|nr:glycosyltransferase family 4 protein [Desulfotomaculum sp.]